MKDGLYIYKENKRHSLTVKEGLVYMRTLTGKVVCQEALKGFEKLLEDDYELQDTNVISLDIKMCEVIEDDGPWLA